ncbi:MAG: hypothetical protein KDD50_07240 [Bdellovibrionales bacterium]|nr:hypothetical protein [Bdellovibrionales bacterium]
MDLFIDKMKEIYPKVPVGSANGGANDEKSTYLHMGVNLLEYDALRIFVENQSAKDIFQKKDVYKWINQIVLKDYFKIRRVLDQLGLLIEDRNVFKVYDDLEKYDGNILKKKQEFAAKPINLENIDDVKIKLDFLVEIDQYMRSQINLPFTHQYNKSEINFFNKEFNQRFTSLDEENTHDLKDILKRYKWINISQFGEKADRDAWLIVQHADNDPEFQKEILSVLKNLWEQGETNAANYAYLFDRVQSSFSDLSKQRPQKYGTQGKCVGPGKWEPLPIEDKEHVDSRRSKLGLPPMSEYIEGFKEICK